jgi:hypothetical protein
MGLDAEFGGDDARDTRANSAIRHAWCWRFHLTCSSECIHSYGESSAFVSAVVKLTQVPFET